MMMGGGGGGGGGGTQKLAESNVRGFYRQRLLYATCLYLTAVQINVLDFINSRMALDVFQCDKTTLYSL